MQIADLWNATYTDDVSPSVMNAKTQHMTGCYVNGVLFRTKTSQLGRKSDNCGVKTWYRLRGVQKVAYGWITDMFYHSYDENTAKRRGFKEPSTET